MLKTNCSERKGAAKIPANRSKIDEKETVLTLSLRES